MIARARERLAGPVVTAAGLLLVLALVVGVGRLIPQEPLLGIGIAAVVLLAGLTLADATIIPLLAVPLLVVVVRVGAGGTELSVSDLVLFGAFWPALVFGRRPFHPALRSLLWLVALYQAATVFTVVNNPYAANIIEWFHAALLIGGALVVGWALGAGGRAGVALTLLLLAILVIAASTAVQGITHLGSGFEPVYPTFPFEMNKNFAGCVLGFGALLAYVHPPWVQWSRFFAMSSFALCCAGLAFTQSRQAIIGLAVALAVVVLRSDDTRRRSKLVVLAGLGGLAFVLTVVRDQIDSGNQFNSIFQRINWFKDSLDVWGTDPLFGAGLRWWYTDRFSSKFQPPQAEIEVLTSTGVVGLIAFVVFVVGALLILWRLPTLYGTLAFTMVMSRFVQAQFDLFWVAAQVSIPFVIAGVCLGQWARDTGAGSAIAVTSEVERATARGAA